MKDYMDSQDKLLLILDKISESNERQARIETKMEVMKDEIEGIKKQDMEQNKLLAEHIQGTVANTERLNLEIENRRELESRVETLEKVPNMIITITNWAYKIALWLGTPVGVAYEIGRMLHKW